MTWKRLKALSSVLLAGEKKFPDDEMEAVCLLQYALEEVALISESSILTIYANTADNQNRLTETGYIKRNEEGGITVRAKLPTGDDNEIEIDEGLTYAVARLMASYIATEKTSWHKAEAENIIRRYGQNLIALREYKNGVK